MAKYDHSNLPGLKFHVTLTRDLRKEVLDKMVHQAMSKIRIAEQMAQMTYHRVNQNSVSQEKDEFDE